MRTRDENENDNKSNNIMIIRVKITTIITKTTK